MRVIRLTDPSFEPVSVSEAKTHLRLAPDEGDDLEIMGFISASRRRAEDYCNRAFVSASWAVLFDGDLPVGDAILSVPMPDVSDVTSVKYRDLDGVVQTWASSAYSFDGERKELRPVDAWPDGTQLRVEVVAGSSNPYSVPAPVKSAILNYIGEAYDNRQAGNFLGKKYELNPGPVVLLQPYRERMGM